jgi:hypothetical protein
MTARADERAGQRRPAASLAAPDQDDAAGRGQRQRSTRKACARPRCRAVGRERGQAAHPGVAGGRGAATSASRRRSEAAARAHDISAMADDATAMAAAIARWPMRAAHRSRTPNACHQTGDGATSTTITAIPRSERLQDDRVTCGLCDRRSRDQRSSSQVTPARAVRSAPDAVRLQRR